MNPPSQPTVKRRRIWPWILVLGLSPFFILGLVAASFLTLDGDASALRRRVMTATHSDWQPMVQLSIGRFSLAAIRAGVVFVPKVDARARLGLQAVNSASVGVGAVRVAVGAERTPSASPPRKSSTTSTRF